ncbi:hypothetical protein R6Q59_020167 [Mikania micrantha]
MTHIMSPSLVNFTYKMSHHQNIESYTISTMSSWVVLFIVLLVGLCFSFNGVSGARHRKDHRSAAILTGTVYCDTCFRQQLPKSTHFISGATVAVECGGAGGQPKFREEVKTNEKGEFEAKLPAFVGRNVEKIKECSVKLISSSEPYCAVAATATATSPEIHFKSKKAGTHVFSAGFFTFRPQLCNQKNYVTKHLPSPESDKLSDQKTFGFPMPPNPFQPPSLIPPLPFQPSPPSLFPPLPFQPSPPSLIPPIFPSPPPASWFPPLPFPPVPSLIPSPPPPPPPAFPIPLPPFPRVPGFPPVPPASTSPGEITP